MGEIETAYWAFPVSRVNGWAGDGEGGAGAERPPVEGDLTQVVTHDAVQLHAEQPIFEHLGTPVPPLRPGPFGLPLCQLERFGGHAQ